MGFPVIHLFWHQVESFSLTHLSCHHVCRLTYDESLFFLGLITMCVGELTYSFCNTTQFLRLKFYNVRYTKVHLLEKFFFLNTVTSCQVTNGPQPQLPLILMFPHRTLKKKPQRPDRYRTETTTTNILRYKHSFKCLDMRKFFSYNSTNKNFLIFVLSFWEGREGYEDFFIFLSVLLKLFFLEPLSKIKQSIVLNNISI